MMNYLMQPKKIQLPGKDAGFASIVTEAAAERVGQPLRVSFFFDYLPNGR